MLHPPVALLPPLPRHDVVTSCDFSLLVPHIQARRILLLRVVVECRWQRNFVDLGWVRSDERQRGTEKRNNNISKVHKRVLYYLFTHPYKWKIKFRLPWQEGKTGDKDGIKSETISEVEFMISGSLCHQMISLKSDCKATTSARDDDGWMDVVKDEECPILLDNCMFIFRSKYHL